MQVAINYYQHLLELQVLCLFCCSLHNNIFKDALDSFCAEKKDEFGQKNAHMHREKVTHQALNNYNTDVCTINSDLTKRRICHRNVHC